MGDPQHSRRVLVAIDIGNSRWPDVIRRAARLAKSMSAELHTLYLEDEDVRIAAQHPFTVEISLRRAQRQPFSPEDVSHARDRLLESMRAAVEQTLRETQLSGSFDIVEHQQLWTSLRRGDICWVRHRSSVARLALPVPAMKETLYVVFSDQCDRDDLLAVSQKLLQEDYRQLVIFNLTDTDNGELETAFGETGKAVRSIGLSPDTRLGELVNLTPNSAANTLLLPEHFALAGDPAGFALALEDRRFETLVAK
jgi:nucleotide-binding universal stress UspA family protein